MNDEIDFSKAELIIDESKNDSLNIVEASPAIEKPKRGRGRPKGTTKKAPRSKPLEAKESAPKLSLDDELKKMASEYVDEPSAAKTESPETAEDSPSKGVYISGAILLTICDALIPRSITFVLGGGAERAKGMKLDKQERAELIPIADEAAKELMQNITPLQQFFLAMSAIYISKL